MYNVYIWATYTVGVSHTHTQMGLTDSYKKFLSTLENKRRDIKAEEKLIPVHANLHDALLAMATSHGVTVDDMGDRIRTRDTMRNVRSWDSTTEGEFICLIFLRQMGMTSDGFDDGASLVIDVIDTGEDDSDKDRARGIRNASAATKPGKVISAAIPTLTLEEANDLAQQTSDKFVARCHQDGPLACWSPNTALVGAPADEDDIFGVSENTSASIELKVVADTRSSTYEYADNLFRSGRDYYVPPCGRAYAARGGSGGLRAIGETAGFCVTATILAENEGSDEIRGHMPFLPQEKLRCASTVTHDNLPSPQTIAGSRMATAVLFLRSIPSAKWLTSGENNDEINVGMLCSALAQRSVGNDFQCIIYEVRRDLLDLRAAPGARIKTADYLKILDSAMRKVVEDHGVTLETVVRRVYTWVNVPQQPQADRVIQTLYTSSCAAIPLGLVKRIQGPITWIHDHEDSDWLFELIVASEIALHVPVDQRPRKVYVICNVHRRYAQGGPVYVSVRAAADAIASEVMKRLGVTRDPTTIQLPYLLAGVARIVANGNDKFKRIPFAPESMETFHTFSSSICEGPLFGRVMQLDDKVRERAIAVATHQKPIASLFDKALLGRYLFRPHTNNKRVQSKTNPDAQVAYGIQVANYFDIVLNSARTTQ